MKTIQDFYSDLLRRNRSLAVVGLGYFVLFALLVALFLFDSRQLLGLNIWVKPMKFAISIGIFTWTFAYLLDLIPISSRRKAIFSNIVIYTMLIEIIIIIGQAAAGQRSHFNIETPTSSILYSVMGLSILVAFIMICLTTIDYFRLKTQLSPSLLWAIRLGLLILIFGNIGGIMMSQSLRHSIGVADGGEGLPFVNWSTIAGDLRVMHFFGMHAIQLLPLVALGLIKVIKLEQHRLYIILALGIAYAGFVALVFWQALNAMPFWIL